MSSLATASDSTVTQSGTTLKIDDGLGTLQLPFLWLRDNCECDDCRITQTGEKKFLLSQVPVDLEPTTFELKDGLLTLVWPDGHSSRYTIDAIRDLGTPRHKPLEFWGRHFEPRRIDWHPFLQDANAAIGALERFLADGVLVLTNAPSTPNTLEALAQRLGPIRELLFDRIHDVEADPSGYNVAHTTFQLPPHNDFASYSWQPSVQALHMLTNEASGGDSIILDGFALLQDLRDQHLDAFNMLATTPVPFREYDADTETYAIEPIIRLGPGGDIKGLRFSNQLMQVMDPGQPGMDEFYRAYHHLCQKIDDSAYQHQFRLCGGEILLVASHRVLHARTAFDPDGPRHLQDAYFELDNVANNLVVLRRSNSAPQEDPCR